MSVYGVGQPASAFYTQANFYTVTHEAPAWFVGDAFSGFYGETTGGHGFLQRPVLPESGIRLHRFEIGTAFFYISDRGIITAGSDLAALSIYYTLA
jgi:hypothetical protein